jgi:O-antigen/teichoic acid export membrane protein
MKTRWNLGALYARRVGLASNAGLAVARSAIDAFGSGVLVIVIARGLGADALGAYIYAATVGALVYSLGSLSVTPVVARDVARRPANVRTIASVAIQLRTYVVLPLNVVAIALIAQVIPMTGQTKVMTILLAVAVGLGFVTDVAFGLFQATSQFKIPLVITGAYKVATLALAIAIVSRGGRVVDIALAVVALQVGQTLLAIGLVRRFVTPLDWWPRPAMWSQLAVESSSLAVASLADTIANRADLVILGLLRPVSDVGVYSAAYNLYIGATVIATAVQTALLPAFARSSAATFSRLWQRSGLAVCTLGSLIGLAFVAFGDGLVQFAYGSTLAAATQPLHILGPAATVYVAERLLMTTLISRGWQRFVLYATVPSAAANVVINVVAVPRYGYNGAAAATLGSELMALFIAALLVWWKIPSLRPSVSRL